MRCTRRSSTKWRSRPAQAQGRDSVHAHANKVVRRVLPRRKARLEGLEHRCAPRGAGRRLHRHLPGDSGAPARTCARRSTRSRSATGRSASSTPSRTSGGGSTFAPVVRSRPWKRPPAASACPSRRPSACSAKGCGHTSTTSRLRQALGKRNVQRAGTATAVSARETTSPPIASCLITCEADGRGRRGRGGSSRSCLLSQGLRPRFSYPWLSVCKREALCRTRTVDPLLTIEQRRGNRGHGRELASTKAAQEEGNGRRRVTARARACPRWCSLIVPFGSGCAVGTPQRRGCSHTPEGALARRRTRAPRASGGPRSRGPRGPVRRCREPSP